MHRRSFLTGAAALIATPSLVRASSLEYVPRGVKLGTWTPLLDAKVFVVPYFDFEKGFGEAFGRTMEEAREAAKQASLESERRLMERMKQGWLG